LRSLVASMFSLLYHHYDCLWKTRFDFLNITTWECQRLLCGVKINGVDGSTKLLRFVAFVHLPFSFNFRSLDLSLLHTCFRRAHHTLLLGLMFCIDRAVWFCFSKFYRGHRSSWLLLLSTCCFAEFDHSVICIELMLCLGSFLFKTSLKVLKYWFSREKGFKNYFA